MLNPFAFYDILALSNKLQVNLGSCVRSEIHLFSYLSCLLSLYKKCPSADWGYSFAGTEYSSPFCKDIEDAITMAINYGLLIEADQYIQISKRGIQEYQNLFRLRQNIQRETFLDGACSSVLAIPVNILRSSLLSEPGLKTSTQLVSPRLLLDESNPSLVLLYDQFQVLSKTIGVELENLMVPAVLWLTYLSNTQGNSRDGVAV
jgi:hypothetical protein